MSEDGDRRRLFDVLVRLPEEESGLEELKGAGYSFRVSVKILSSGPRHDGKGQDTQKSCQTLYP